MKRGIGGLVIVVLLLSFTAAAVLAQDLDCAFDFECDSLGENYVCNPDTMFCVEDSTMASTGTDADSEISSDATDADSTIDASSTDDPDPTVTEDFEVLKDRSVGHEARIVTLEKKIASVEQLVTDNNNLVSEIKSNQENLKSEQTNLNLDLQSIGTTQNQVEREVNVVSVGLASLQEELAGTKGELETTKSELAKESQSTKLFRSIILFVIVLLTFASIAFFLNMHSKKQIDLPLKTKQYITSQIKRGQGKMSIVNSLKQSGWNDRDANWAYEYTKKSNYNDYLKSQGKKEQNLPARKLHPGHHQKILIVSALTLLILASLVFFINNSTGQATYMTGSSSESELSLGVEEILTTYIDQNEFYAALEYLELCVQVDDGGNSASYLTLITPYGHSISENDPCEWDSTSYDFAIKFTSYSTFESTLSSLSCTSMELAHAVSAGSELSRGVYILPSYYVAEGLATQATVDYSEYCSALSLCFSNNDISLFGISC